MELKSRQIVFLKRAIELRERVSHIITIEAVADNCGYERSEAVEIAETLIAEGAMHYPSGRIVLDGKEIPPELTASLRLGGRPCIIDPKAIEYVRQFDEDERKERRAKRLTKLHWALTVLIAIAIPIIVGLVNRRLERIEKQQQQSPNNISTTMIH